MQGSASTRIARPAEVVWAMVTDIGRMGSWSPETRTAFWIDGAAGPAVDARFKGKNRRGLLRWTTTLRVTECEPGRSFAFVVLAKDREATRWTYHFTAVDDDSCEVTESYEVLWEPWYGKIFTPERRRGPQLDEGIEMTLSRLKTAAEAGLAPS
ncbi:MAG: SRPBCC family protein [Acidimicrobiia bacterium]